ncbi:MAG: peptidoglycan bridge formation glycyltransferase FemA/FemB family protein [bacterium]|nr:peptidoglycan bridge formation glycyltransferase FemA/FemB family protein [bacterium]
MNFEASIRAFFKSFFEKKDLGKYFLIQFNSKIIGGIMCPIYKGTIYEWFVCGLDGQIDNVYPSVLATWAPIAYAANSGLKYFDFMGAGKPDDEYGVREFKSKFGGELVNYGRFVRINNPFLYNIGKIGLKVLGKIR